MATFIKTGFWEKRKNPPQGFKGELNLDQFVKNNATPYKVYTALLTQSGINDPTATVLENNLGFDITWLRGNEGIYSSSTFSSSLIVSVIVGNTFEDIITSYSIANAGPSNNYINIVTKFSDGTTYFDGKLNKTFIEIRVYN